MIGTSILLILDDSSGEDPTSKLHSSLPLSSMFKADSLPSRVLTSIINLQENKKSLSCNTVIHRLTFSSSTTGTGEKSLIRRGFSTIINFKIRSTF